MSRSKPYDRRDRNLDAPWKHDLHSTHSLASRLDRSGSGSGSSSPSLLSRLGAGSGGGSGSGGASSGRGKELLPSTSRGGMYGFDGANGSSNPNAGVELLPSSSSSGPGKARPPRGGRREDGRALAAKSIAAITGRARARANERDSASPSLNIVGAARSTWVRVERLARGTTAEDVKSAFAHHPIGDARVSSRPSDRTVTVELEMPDREAADTIVAEYDGVPADGETLRVSLVEGGRRDLGARLRKQPEERGGRGEAREGPGRGDRAGAGRPQGTGKMYADQMDSTPTITAPQGRRQERAERPERTGSLAARMGRR